MRVTPALIVACVAMLVAGCGSSAKSGSGPNTNDKRATALDCLKNDQKIDASILGKDGLQVGAPASGTRIKFFLTNGEAEAAQFEGRGEGSEQIGPALLFVGKASDDELKKVEKCLDDIASG
jgi:hypothetical protein